MPEVKLDKLEDGVLPFFIETVHFADWAPLGGPVALSLTPRCTVLVGRNGGGKSLLLEGLRDGAWGAANTLTLNPLMPRLSTFRVDIRGKDSLKNLLLHYRYEHKGTSLRESRGGQLPVQDDWQELCWIHSPQHELWSVEKGILSVDTKEFHLSGAGGSLLAVKPDVLPMGPAAISRQIIAALLFGMDAVPAVMPVRRHGRETITLKGGDGTIPFSEALARAGTTVNTLADALWELFEENKEGFEELNAVGRRIGIWQELAIEKYVKERGRTADVLAEVTVDDINLGLVSDGTLRLLKILLALVADPHRKGPLLIDEPELGIHPALLGRLLAEFEAYGQGRQLVIATHSPQVVSWARPDELRLVERVDGRTVVRSLSEEQAVRVHSYLQDQGNLGEFVYGGGVDE